MVLKPLTSFLTVSLHDEIDQKEYIIEYIKSAVHLNRDMLGWSEEDQILVR